MGRYEILNGGFAENISVMLTAGIHDRYYMPATNHLSNRSPITGSMTSYYMQNLRSLQTPVEKVHPNAEELYAIIKIALEQCNIIGCFTTNVA